MRKIDYPQAIKESETELRIRLKGLRSAKLRDRCEVLIWLKSGEIRTMKEAVVLKSYSNSQGNKWWKRYKNEGLEGLLRTNYKGQSSPLQGKTALKERLNSAGFNTIKEAQAWILATYGISYTENGLGNYFRHKQIKLKTGRPHHPNQDATKRAAYKKNMKKN